MILTKSLMEGKTLITATVAAEDMIVVVSFPTCSVNLSDLFQMWTHYYNLLQQIGSNFSTTTLLESSRALSSDHIIPIN